MGNTYVRIPYVQHMTLRLGIRVAQIAFGHLGGRVFGETFPHTTLI